MHSSEDLNLALYETISLIKQFKKVDLNIQVLQIRHKKTGQLFALKKISKSRDTQIMNALFKQFNLLKDLDHPNIIKLYSFKETDNQIYALYEYMEKNLKKQLKDITEQESAMIILQIAEGLEYLHSKYILHRDVNVSNIMISGSGTNIKAKLIDFQFAGSLKDQRTTVYGSLDSLPPQVINQLPQNEKVDVWGLGVIIYFLYTKSQPFFVKGQMSYELTTQNITKCNVKYPETLPHSIKNLLQKILITNPLLRLTLTQILGHPYFKEYKQKLDQNKEKDYLQRKVIELERQLANQKSKEIKSKQIINLQNKLEKLQEQYKSAQQIHDKQKMKLKETQVECMRLQKQRRAMQEYRMNLEKSKLQLNKINHNILLVVEQNKKIKKKTAQLEAQLQFLKVQQKQVSKQRAESKKSSSSLSKYISTGSLQKPRSRNHTKEMLPPTLNQNKSSKNLH